MMSVSRVFSYNKRWITNSKVDYNLARCLEENEKNKHVVTIKYRSIISWWYKYCTLIPGPAWSWACSIAGQTVWNYLSGHLLRENVSLCYCMEWTRSLCFKQVIYDFVINQFFMKMFRL